MPWLDDMTWARSAPALASATPRSRYLKKSRRPLTSTGSAARAWATFCAVTFCGDALGRDFVAAADDIVSSLRCKRGRDPDSAHRGAQAEIRWGRGGGKGSP